MSGWVSQYAADAMAQWAEDWDIGTEWKVEDSSKVVADRKKERDESDEDTDGGLSLFRTRFIVVMASILHKQVRSRRFATFMTNIRGYYLNLQQTFTQQH